MQPGNNSVRPSSGDGNGVYVCSNSCSPQPPQILYTNANNLIYRKPSKRRLQKILIGAAIIIFILLLGLCIAIYFVLEMSEKGRICYSHDCVRAAATLLESIDTSVNPCDNFYNFACGNWRKTHPASDPLFINNWFQESYKIVNRDSIDYLSREDAIEEPKSVHQARMVYKTCSDFEMMEQIGLDALWELLDNLGLNKNPLSVPTLVQPWARTLGKVRRYLAVDLLIGAGILPLITNSSLNLLAIAMPREEQILPGSRFKWEDKKHYERFRRMLMDESQKIALNWRKYATKLIEYVIRSADNTTTISENELTDAAYKLLDIQRELLLIEENDDVRESILEPFPEILSLEELQLLVDNVTDEGSSKVIWQDYFEAIYEDISDDRLEFENSEPIMVHTRPYFEQLSKLLETTDEKSIELLIWWNVIYTLAPHVNEDMKELKEIFVKKILEIPSSTRNEVCSGTVTQLMISAVGYQVKDYAEQETISDIQEMLNNVRSSFSNFIYALDWMDKPTKYATVEKLYKMKMFIGYPHWYNNMTIMNNLYMNITLTNSTHLQNILNLIDEHVYEEFISVDYINNSTSDYFDPLDINAYYDPSTNSITVPYGILQRPYFSMGLQALNYGGIGTILGHELTHGLDNTGRMYDSSGNNREWWSNFSSVEYMKRETCYEEVYSNFYIETIQKNVDGAITLSENIADDGGVRDSLAAYRSYVKKHGKEARLPGFSNYTHDQLFFLAFANMWCAEYSNDALVRTLEDDEHSPNFVRVIVVLQNILDFSESWNCPKGSYMNPVKKCKLWE